MSNLKMKQEQHPAHNMPAATENYAGDELNMPVGRPMKPVSNRGMSVQGDNDSE